MNDAARRTSIFLRVAALIAAVMFAFGGCTLGNTHRHISVEEAKHLMATEKDYLIVDVRTPEEYAKRHVKGAVLLPQDEIEKGNVKDTLPDKKQLLLLYCWTGRRSEDSAKMLAKMGYSRVCEFGGLVDWDGETEGDG